MRRQLSATLAVMCLAAHSVMAQANGTIEGRVTDASGAAVLGAVITIEDADGNRRTTVTDEDGAFQMSSLTGGSYNVKISATGLSDWTAANVRASVDPESNRLLAVLQVAPATTTITVGVSPQELATQQLNQELKQRALGIVPNYYVTYERNPAPLSPMQKFRLGFKALVDPTMFAGAAMTAGIQQTRGSYREFGQGAGGFAKRFGAAYGIAAGDTLITAVVANSLLHQDPRYFYSGQGTRAQRAWYAIKSAFLARGDNGKWQPPYSTVAGLIASAELAQTYLPGSRSQETVLGRSILFRFGGLMGLNMGQEFFFKKFTSNKPSEQQAQNAAVLREGTPVTLIAVEGFSPERALSGKTISLVLAEDLGVDGNVFAKTGDVASGQLAQGSAATITGDVSSVALERVMLRAGKLNIPLRSSQLRGVVGPMQYKELPGCSNIEVTLFVARNVDLSGVERP